MSFDAYLKIDTIDGEATAKGHEKWIQILAFNHSLAQSGGGSYSGAGGQSGGRCDHGAFSISKSLDKSSPKIALACCSGQHIKDITVHLCRATGDKSQFMEYKMSDVIVRSVVPSGSQGAELPIEDVAFDYGKIEWTYTEYDHAGKKKGDIKTGWDVSKDTKV